jgi:hypothetical protein
MIRSNCLFVGLSIWASDAAWSPHGGVLARAKQMALLLVPLETHVELLPSTFLRLLRDFFFLGGGWFLELEHAWICLCDVVASVLISF